MSDLLDAAIRYAAAGYEIFPVNETDKTPYTVHGMKDATTDPAQLRQWWLTFPNALIGCRVPADVVILDIDPRYGGAETWDALVLECGSVHTKRFHASGRGDGGRHYWFKRPDVDKVSAKPLHEWARRHGVGRAAGKNGRSWTSGIDVLHHDWRYTILPPSPHPATGKPYEWVIEGEPSRMPNWLAELVARHPDPPSPPLAPNAVDDSIADWYTNTHTWAEVLTGWHVAEGDGESDGSKWRHPNATAASSASIKYGCLFVYSPNTDLEETEEGDPHGYTKFRAWAELEHGGDLSKAAREAYRLRDGDPPELKLKTSDTDAPKAEPENDGLPVPVDWYELFQRSTDVEWLVEDVWPAGRQLQIFAARKTGKSLLMLWIAICIASGRDPFSGHQIRARVVVYLDYEMSPDDLLERLQDMGFGPEDIPETFRYYLLPVLPKLDTAEGGDRLMRLVERDGGELVVIDTLSRVVTGEENSNDTYLALYAYTGLRLKKAGVGLARLDHEGHEGGRARGASAKADDVDINWRLVRVDGGFQLQSKGSRVGYVPDHVDIAHHPDPLRFERRGESWPAGTAQKAAELDELDVAIAASNREAREALKAAGKGIGDSGVLSKALLFRRKRAAEHPAEHPKTDLRIAPTERSSTSPATRAEQSTEHSRTDEPDCSAVPSFLGTERRSPNPPEDNPESMF